MYQPPQWGPGYGYGPPPKPPTSTATYVAFGVCGFIGLLAIAYVAGSKPHPRDKATPSASASASAAPAPMTSAEAQAAWPAALKEGTDALASADRLAAQGKLLDADDALDEEQRALHSRFDPTPVVNQKSFIDLSKKIDDKRKAWAPRVKPLRDAAEKKAAADKKQEEADDAARGPMPGISAWSGSVICVESYLRPRMHDPDSLEMAGCTKPVAVDAYWITNCDYRGSNAFGAKVLNSGRFFIQRDEVVKTEGIN